MFTWTVLFTLLISLVAVGLIAWILLWGLREIKLPEPFNKIGLVIIVLFTVVFLITLLLPFTHLK